MAVIPPVCDFGWKPPDFELPAVDGKVYSFSDIRGMNGTLIMFICNHCPYVLAVLDRIVRDSRELKNSGVGVTAISSNDVIAYPEDRRLQYIEDYLQRLHFDNENELRAIVFVLLISLTCIFVYKIIYSN